MDAVAKYKKKAIKSYIVQLNKNTNSDLIEWLDNQPNKQGLIKRLLEEEKERTK